MQRPVPVHIDFADEAADIVDAVFLDGAALEFIESFAGRAHVNVEHGHVRIGIFFPDIHGMLGVVHAADLGAVRLPPARGIARTDAAHDDDLLRLPARRGTHQVAFRRAAGVGQPFQLERRDDVLAAAPAQVAEMLQIKQVEARRQHDGAVLFRHDFILLGVVDGLVRAHKGAHAALARLEPEAVRPVDDGHLGDGLGKGDVDGPALAQAGIELAAGLAGRTLGGADAAAAADVGLDAACLFADVGLELADEAADRFHFAVGEDADVGMLGRVHHLRGQDAG